MKPLVDPLRRKNYNLIFESFYFNNINDTILLRMIFFSTVTPDV